MLVAQAHSFTQQARLAITLAWVAGYTNVLTILTCGKVTSHVSGTTSEFGRALAEGRWSVAVLLLWLLTTFYVGAATSGVATELGKRRGWDSIYVLPIAIEAVLLALFAFGVEIHNRAELESGPKLWMMTGLACVAMGVQNATITRISNGVVRTTHVTGVVTDLGLESVQFVLWLMDRHKNAPPLNPRALARSVQVHPTARRLALLGSIVGSFALGAGLGTLAFDAAPRLAMSPPVVFLVWVIFQDLIKPIAEIEPSKLVGVGTDVELPAGLAVYHLRKDSSRRGKVHRLPDMLSWSDRLDHQTKVVILDLGEVTNLDANAALELRALLSRFKAQNRSLIVSGINGTQYEMLRRWGAGDSLDPTNVCSDLELAIARGMLLV